MRRTLDRMTTPSAMELRREKLLLLACARSRADAAGTQRIRELVGEDLDWAYLAGLGEEHGVAPLLYVHLRAACAESVPPFWLEYLGQVFQHNAHRNLFLTAELLRLLDIFRAHGVLAIPYKGPVLAEQAYANLAFRQFADLDVIVAQSDMPAAHALLLAEGYRAKFPHAPAATRRIPGQYSYTRDAEGLVLEFHTERTLRYFPTPLPFEQLAKRLECVSLGGRSVPTFSVEDALPILCVHGSKDFWERILWVADIAALAQSPRRIGWETCLRRAGEFRVTRMLFLGLLLAEDLLGEALPEGVQRAVRADSATRSLAEQVRAQYFAEAQPEWSAIRRLAFRARMCGNFWRSSGYVLRLALAPTEEDWSRVRLPGALSHLYALLRPFRLLRDYGLSAKRSPESIPRDTAVAQALPENRAPERPAEKR